MTGYAWLSGIARLVLGIGGVVLAWFSWGMAGDVIASQAQTGREIQPLIYAFDRLSETDGWVWFGKGLYLTQDGGQTWQEITPPLHGGLRLSAVAFLDSENGWAVLMEENDQEGNRAWLASTSNGGRSWTMAPLPLMEEDAFVPVAAHYLTVWDRHTLWVVRKFFSSANFSHGVLLRTLDGGKSWQRFDLPIAEPLLAQSRWDVWLQGGASGEELFHSTDGGTSWTEVSRDAVQPSMVLEQAGDDLQMVSASQGWKLERKGNCEAGELHAIPQGGYRQELHCTTIQQLWATEDGGKSWQVVKLPDGKDTITNDQLFNTAYLRDFSPLQPLDEETPVSPLIAVMQGQAFDKCEVPSLKQLGVWKAQSPYRAVNLYIGGIHRACKNAALTPEFIAQLRQQGWGLIPTWVGYQAAWTSFKYRMSADPLVAYQQGRAEAEAATLAAQQLGLTNSEGNGSVIYYDLEYYDINKSECNQAARAFINGWVERMNELGMIGGVYSTGGPLSQFADIPNPPPVIWAAHWIDTFYNPEATVWNVYRLSNELWKDRQRLRQYAGGHAESWGEVQMNIDSNVMDGMISFHFYIPSGLDYQTYFPLIAK